MNSIPPHAQYGNVPQKKCTGPCKRILDATLDNFYRIRGNKLRPICKQCHNAKGKDYYDTHALEQQEYRAQHRAQRKLTNTLYYQENCEDLKQDQREYNATHREERARYNETHCEERQRYRQENRERLSAQKKQYHQTERGRIAQRVSAHNHNARKRDAEGAYTLVQLEQQLQRQKFRCYYCRVTLGKGRNAYHADHVIPLSRGGTNYISNIVCTCPTCNIRKNDRLPHEWIDGGRLL